MHRQQPPIVPNGARALNSNPCFSVPFDVAAPDAAGGFKVRLWRAQFLLSDTFFSLLANAHRHRGLLLVKELCPSGGRRSTGPQSYSGIYERPGATHTFPPSGIDATPPNFGVQMRFDQSILDYGVCTE